MSYSLIHKFHWSKPMWETLKNMGVEGKEGGWRSGSRWCTSWNVASFPGDGPTSCRCVWRVPLSFRRIGFGPSALLLREVLGALWRPSSAHAPGWTHTATPPSLCQHHVQFHGDVEVSGLVSYSPLGVSSGRSHGLVSFKGLRPPSCHCPSWSRDRPFISFICLTGW